MATDAAISPAVNSKALPQNGAAARLRKRTQFWRLVHLSTGFVFAVWLVLMAVTGVLINHQADWGLDEVEVSNGYLPGPYTTEYSPDTTRLNVVVADLHSGNFFWGMGKFVTDLVALLVLISVSSGVYAFHLRRKVVRLCQETCDLACMELEKVKKDSRDRGALEAASLPETPPVNAIAEEAEEEAARVG